MTRIIAIANRKGGVGKTTVAINLGAALAELGRKVLLVDLDEQANCTTGVGLKDPKRPVEATTAGMLLNPAQDPSSCILSTDVAGLDCIPGHRALRATLERLADIPGKEVVLREILGKITGYDFVLLDCPPALNALTDNALTAASHLYIPVEPGKWDLDGTHELLARVTVIQSRLNPHLLTQRVLLNSFDSRTTLSRAVLEILQEQFADKVFSTQIRVAVKIREATLADKPLLAYARSHEAAQDFRDLAQEVIAQ